MPENEVNKASFWQKSVGGCVFSHAVQKRFQTGTLARVFADTWQFNALFACGGSNFLFSPRVDEFEHVLLTIIKPLFLKTTGRNTDVSEMPAFPHIARYRFISFRK